MGGIYHLPEENLQKADRIFRALYFHLTTKWKYLIELFVGS